MKKIYQRPNTVTIRLQATPLLQTSMGKYNEVIESSGDVLSRRGRWLSEEWDDYKEQHSGELFEDEEFDY